MRMMKSAALALLLGFLATSAFAQSYSWNGLILRGASDYSGHFYGGSFVQRADGKMLVTYRIKSHAMLSVVDTESQLLTVSNASKAQEQAIYKYYTLPDNARTVLQRLSNGK